MKKPTVYEKQYGKQSPFPNSYYPFNVGRTNSTSADFSMDKQFRRISPAPQDRLSHVPKQLIYSAQTYPSHDYIIPSKHQEPPPRTTLPDHAKTIQDLLQRVQKLQGKNLLWQKIDQRIERLQGNTLKMGTLLQSMQVRKEDILKGKENIVTNIIDKKEEQGRTKTKDYVTKEELQRQLSGLDNTVKTLLTSFKKSISEEVGTYNRKNKQKFTDITSRQLSEKLEQFKSAFMKEWNTRLQNIVKETWQSQVVGKSVMGVARQTFIGNTIPVKVKQELTVQKEGLQENIATLQVQYFLDTQGFLLDKELHYLLDKNGKQIQLQSSLLLKLQQEGILVKSSSSHSPNELREPKDQLSL